MFGGLVRVGRDRPHGRVRAGPPPAWNGFHLDTAVTLPVGVEAYAAYALRAWLSTSPAVSPRTRRFAHWSAIGSLMLGMAEQVAYHLLAQAHARHAPWLITTAVARLPVLVLGMGATLAHLLHADTMRPEHAGGSDPSTPTAPRVPDVAAGHAHCPDRLALAQAAAADLNAAGQRVSRRALRAAGIHGSNAELSALARDLEPANPQLTKTSHEHHRG